MNIFKSLPGFTCLQCLHHGAYHMTKAISLFLTQEVKLSLASSTTADGGGAQFGSFIRSMYSTIPSAFLSPL